MNKKLLTMEDLVSFCAQNKLYKFNASESGYKVCVQVPSVYEKDDSESTDSILYAKLKLFHTGRNRNGSNVTKEAAKKCMDSLKYKPILANFCEIDGIKDFTSHDMEITEDGVNYLEHQIGCITADEPTIVEEDDGRNFVYAKGAIPREYTDAAEIIERKDGTKLSVEIAVNSMEYNIKDKELALNDIEIIGVTLLGKNPQTGENVEEGMKGARLDIEDFSIPNNSVKFEQSEKLIEILEKLNLTLSNFNIDADFSAKDNSKEGGNDQMKFDELLAKYGKTADDVTFEYENLSDEELETAFEKAFADSASEEANAEGDEPEEAEANNDEVIPVEDDVKTSTDETDIPEKKPTYSIKSHVTQKEFEISLGEKHTAISEIVNATYEDEGCWYWCDVFEGESDVENYVVMHGYDRIYKQAYKFENNAYSLIGERVEVFAKYLTKEESDALDLMRSTYSSISEKLAKYEAEPEKLEIFSSKEYEAVSNSEEFKALADEKAHFDMSVEDVRKKADEILLNYAKSGNLNFAINEPKEKVSQKKIISSKKKAGRYGSIFSK